MKIVCHQNQTQIRDGKRMMKMMTGKRNSIGLLKMKKKMNIKRCGYSPYGYIVYINNRRLEFATESEFDEWIGECNYGFISDV